MAQAVGNQAAPAPRRRRRRSRRWLRWLCFLVGGGAGLASVLGLVGVVMFSRFSGAVPSTGLWFGLSPVELAGVEPKGFQWWLALLGWMAVGLAGLFLMGRGATRRRRPPVLSTLALALATCLVTYGLGKAAYARPGKVIAIAGMSRLQQLTGISFPPNTRLIAGRARAGEGLSVRAVLTMPTSAVGRFLMADGGAWPRPASARDISAGEVQASLADLSDMWRLEEWDPERVARPEVAQIRGRDDGRAWLTTIAADTADDTAARIYLEYGEDSAPEPPAPGE